MTKQLTVEEKRKWIYNEVHNKYFTNKPDWHPEIRGPRGKFYKVVDAFEGKNLYDGNFYDNDNLSQQYYVQPLQTSSKVGGALAEVEAESRIEKRIEQAEKETFGRMVLYASDKAKDIWVLDFLFYNRSFVRNMEDFKILAKFETSPEPTVFKWSEIISSKPYNGEKNKFYNNVSVAVDKQDILNMAQKKGTLYVTFDDVTVEFSKSYTLIDALAIDFLNDTDSWNDAAIEKYYPVFLGSKVKQDVKALDIEDKEVLKLFVKDPLNVTQFAELNDYCEMTNKKSSFIENIQTIFNGMKRDEVETELRELDDRLKKGPKAIVRLFSLIGIGIIAIAFLYAGAVSSDDFGRYLAMTLTFFLINWAICFMSAFINRGELPKKIESALEGVSGVLIILHIIWGIQCLGEDFGFHLWGSWIILVAGLIFAEKIGNKYSRKNFGTSTKSLIESLKGAMKKL